MKLLFRMFERRSTRSEAGTQLKCCPGILNVLELPHLQKRHQEGKRGLRSLIFVCPVRVKAIATSAGAGIVQGGFQIVISQEPVERSPSLRAPLFIASRTICLQAC